MRSGWLATVRLRQAPTSLWFHKTGLLLGLFACIGTESTFGSWCILLSAVGIGTLEHATVTGVLPREPLLGRPRALVGRKRQRHGSGAKQCQIVRVLASAGTSFLQRSRRLWRINYFETRHDYPYNHDAI